jgi:hypothetical protein
MQSLYRRTSNTTFLCPGPITARGAYGVAAQNGLTRSAAAAEQAMQHTAQRSMMTTTTMVIVMMMTLGKGC